MLQLYFLALEAAQVLGMSHVSESSYSNKLAHVQVVINCRYLAAPMCTSEEILERNLSAQS